MKPNELAYNILKDACRSLLLEMREGVPPTPAQQHCFVILWQAQCAIIHNCDIYSNVAIQANLATSGHAVKDDTIISLDFSHFGA